MVQFELLWKDQQVYLKFKVFHKAGAGRKKKSFYANSLIIERVQAVCDSGVCEEIKWRNIDVGLEG